MRFTSEDAFKAQKAKRPIMISLDVAARYLRQHGLHEPSDIRQMLFECELPQNSTEVDAATVLGWLGY